MSTRTRPARADLERPCDTCAAAAYEPCTTRAGDIFDGVHIDRRVNTATGPLAAIRPAPWSGRERRATPEVEIRADERAQITLALTGWLAGLSETDERTPGILAALERIGGRP